MQMVEMVKEECQRAWLLSVAIRSHYRAALRRNEEMTPEYLRDAAQNEVEQWKYWNE